HSAQVGYLPGLSVWSLHVLPVFTRGFLHYEPQQTKHAEEQNTLLSIPDQDGRITLLGLRVPKGCPLLLAALEGQSSLGKCRGKIHCDLSLRVCVCVCLCAVSPYKNTCV